MGTQWDSDARTLGAHRAAGIRGWGGASTRAGVSGLLHTFCLEQLLCPVSTRTDCCSTDLVRGSLTGIWSHVLVVPGSPGPDMWVRWTCVLG